MFVPLRDVDNPVSVIAWPFVTHTIIAVNVIVYLVLNAVSVEEGVGTLVFLSFHHGPVEFQAGAPYTGPMLPGPIAAVTSAFLHVDFVHLLGNMLFLWVFGDNVEDALGHWKFLLFYVLAAVAAAYAQSIFTDPGYILYGASGAVSAVIAAFLMLHPRVRLWVLVLMKVPLPVSAVWAIGAWVLFQLFNVVVEDTDPGVGWFAHLGGIVAGAVLLPLLKRPDVPLFDRGPTKSA
jgi:membrane associated rhomboid family serine protease